MEAAMGLRGPHANVRLNHQQPSDELVITDAALRIYRKMRKLDRQCQCPPLPGSDGSVCPACEAWWQLNGELNAALGVGPIAWLPSYEAPDDEVERDYTPKQSGRDRFFKLEKAASKSKKRRYEFKWQK
jgi:hypothetical protein